MIRGTQEYGAPLGTRKNFHVDRAFWLTCKVETGARFGSVQSYDGCGMTCGLDQHIAVYPKELADKDNNALDDQGTLWKLLRRIEMVDSNDPGFYGAVGHLWTCLDDENFYLAQDGVLRYADSGDPVDGKTIREALTPNKGCPTTKEHKTIASLWAKAFHAVFNHPDSWKAQIEYGKEHLVKRTKRRKIYLGSSSVSPHVLAYSGEITTLQVGDEFSLEEDLALCMYQANSVNAPAIANRCLKRTRRFSNWHTRLIKALGNNKYGRWDDDIPGGRYQRTRSAARASGLWPRSLFDGPKAIMPKNLPG
jgi:hypothetical protein